MAARGSEPGAGATREAPVDSEAAMSHHPRPHVPAQPAAERAAVRRPVNRLGAIGLLVAVAGFLALAAYFWPYVNDDAYITFRYSRFITLGRGPYFNDGEHVEGYTNFLLMLLLVPVIALGGADAAPVCAKGLGVVSGAIGVVLSFWLARRLDDDATPDSGLRATVCGLVAATLVALAPGYALNSTSGLETTLFGALLTAGVCTGLASLEGGRWRGSGVLFALAALTRPEGALLFAVFWCGQLLCSATWRGPGHGTLGRRLATWWTLPAVRRHLLPDALIVVVAVAAHLVFRLLAYDGHWVPNTYWAKSGGFGALEAWRYIRAAALRPFGDSPGVFLAFVGWLIVGTSAVRRRSAPAILVAVVGATLPFVTGTDWMLGGRLIVPFMPLLAVFVALGWVRMLAWATRRWTRWGLLAALAVPLLWGLHLSGLQAGLRNHVVMRSVGYAHGHAALARWLRDTAARPGDTIALMDIGIVGYTCIDQSILDLTGLTDRHIAALPGAFLSKLYDPRYVLDKRPAFIVLVLTAPGDPTQPPPADFALSDWTAADGALRADPEFRAHYVRQRGPAADSAPLDRIAAQLGAQRVFLHLHPALYYFLAVFERQP